MTDKRVFVSRRSHEHGLRPGFVYREPPDNETDSGWRVLVGDETAAEVDDPASILFLTVSPLLERWPELRAVFDSDAPSGEWIWDADAGRYRQRAD